MNTPHVSNNVDWNGVFQGIKLYEPTYGVVIHHVLIAELNSADMIDSKTIKHLETEKNMKVETIIKITPLQ